MPFYITPQLQFSERYIEYPLRPKESASEDYISDLLATLQLNYEYSRGHLGSNLTVESTYSKTENYLTNRLNLNQLGDINYLYQGVRWSAVVKGSYVSTRLGETVPQLNEGLLTHSTEFTQEGGSFQENYIYSRQTTFQLSYAYANNEYSSTDYTNSEAHTVLPAVSYQFRTPDQLTLLGGASYYIYKPGRRIKSVSANVQWSHRTGGSTLVQVASGGGVTTGHNVFWLANFLYSQDFETGTMQATLVRNFGLGGGLTDSIVINNQANFSYSIKLLRNLNGTLNGGYGISDGAIPGSSYHVESWNSTLGLSYIISKRIAGSLTYSHYEQHRADRLEDTLSSNQVWLAFSSNFAPWRPF